MFPLLLFSTLAIVPIQEGVTPLGGEVSWGIVNESQESREHLQLKRSEQKAPSFGLTDDRYIFAVTVINHLEDNQFVVDIAYPLLDYVSLKIVRPGGVEENFRSGDMREFSNRYYQTRTINFPLRLNKLESATLIFEVQTSGSMQFPISLYTEKAFSQKVVNDLGGLSLYYGAMLIMAAYNFVVFLGTRSRGYFFYCLSLVTYLLFQTSANGTAFQFLLPNSPEVANEIFILSACSAIGFMCLFVNYFLDLNVYSRRAHITFHGLAVLSFGMSLISLLVPYRVMILPAAILCTLTPLSFFVIGLYFQFKGVGFARYFNLAWTTFILGMTTYGLKSVGLLPNIFITEYSIQIGSAIEVTLLSLALGDRYESIRKEAEKRQQEYTMLQEKMKQELEIRIETVAGLAHRMNNPLHYIKTSFPVVSREVLKIKTDLFNLVPNSHEAREVRNLFNEYFAKIDIASANIDDAIIRSSESIKEICSLSGLDGFQVSYILSGELIQSGLDRYLETYGESCRNRIKVDMAEAEDIRVACNRYAVVVALAKIFSMLDNKDLDKTINLACISSEKYLTLSVSQRGLSKYETSKIQFISYFLSSFELKFKHDYYENSVKFTIEIPRDISTYHVGGVDAA